MSFGHKPSPVRRCPPDCNHPSPTEIAPKLASWGDGTVGCHLPHHLAHPNQVLSLPLLSLLTSWFPTWNQPNRTYQAFETTLDTPLPKKTHKTKRNPAVLRISRQRKSPGLPNSPLYPRSLTRALKVKPVPDLDSTHQETQHAGLRSPCRATRGPGPVTRSHLGTTNSPASGKPRAGGPDRDPPGGGDPRGCQGQVP